ncbi:MAG TPA: type II secretion system major pseudopilin GspG [Terriglobia bacterium]|nr:type II secretion system major pseudopilin GspG [Terriglobia bacterium]
MRKRIQKNDRGITLIELLVVMVIIAMFATLVGSRLFRNVEKSRQAVAKEQIAEFESTLDLFRLDVGRYPTTAEGLDALHAKPSGVENWDGPYLKKDVPMDPWGHAYVYRCPGQHGDFDLLSYGADGQEGGDGDGADVKNWK